MAIKSVSLSMLAVMALLSDSRSPNLVRASYNTVSEGVVRIDLERKFVQHFDNLQLDDTVDPELMDDLQLNVNAELDTDLLIDNEENNYSVLREMQRTKVAKSAAGPRNLKQLDSSNLVQQSQDGILENSNMVQTGI